SATRSGFYTNMIQNGVMTRNEVRDLEDLAPLPGGDELMVQMQMVGLKDQGKTSG
ncbi:phage portal protein, partial [Acinetobacter baumannii]